MSVNSGRRAERRLTTIFADQVRMNEVNISALPRVWMHTKRDRPNNNQNCREVSQEYPLMEGTAVTLTDPLPLE